MGSATRRIDRSISLFLRLEVEERDPCGDLFSSRSAAFGGYGSRGSKSSRLLLPTPAELFIFLGLGVC